MDKKKLWDELALDTTETILDKLVSAINDIPDGYALSLEELLNITTRCVVYGRYIERTQMIDNKIAEDLLKNVKLDFGEGE